MTRIARAVVVLAFSPAPCGAQLAEFQAGIVGAYSPAHAYGPGAGLAVGFAPGRLAYMGLRWTYYFGALEHLGIAPTSVRTKAQVIAVDLGVQVPLGVVEVFPFVSVGWNQFTQRATQPASSGSSKKILAAPGMAVELRVARLAFIPEVQYIFAGSPQLPWRIDHRGLLLSVRWVFLSELRRIRR